MTKPPVKPSAEIGLSLGAGEGNRTLVCSLGSCRSTIELRPQSPFSAFLAPIWRRILVWLSRRWQIALGNSAAAVRPRRAVPIVHSIPVKFAAR